MSHASPIQLTDPWAEDNLFLPQALALGTYRHDIAYTGALKSLQWLALGTYRHDIAYTGALKSQVSFTSYMFQTGVMASASAPVSRFDDCRRVA